LAFAGVAAAGYVFGISSDRVSAQPPGPMGPPAAQPQPPQLKNAQPAPEPDRRAVAYITVNNNLVMITREELGDFLIARGGHAKLELLVNRKIIEAEAARRGITITTTEIKAKLEENLRGLSVSLKDFEERILPRYGKSLYEYVEDVIRPELIMNKMCRDRVKVSDEDIQKAYENRYGERRQARIICWNKQDNQIALKQWEEARKGDAEFRSIARAQADPNLAAAEGLTKPVGKHLENVNDKTIVETLYKLKVGEISGILQPPSGLMCIKCEGIIPADPTKKLDDKMKTALHNELFAKKLEQELPKLFRELKEAAQPKFILTGPPSAAEFREGVGHIINQTGGVPSVPMPQPPLPMAPRP
jgi:hypothetical protein